ncbi:hypothetical protein COP1_027044 [Malus domestica]
MGCSNRQMFWVSIGLALQVFRGHCPCSPSVFAPNPSPGLVVKLLTCNESNIRALVIVEVLGCLPWVGVKLLA